MEYHLEGQDSQFVNNSINVLNLYAQDMLGGWNSLGSVLVTKASRACGVEDAFNLPNSTFKVEAALTELPFYINQSSLALNATWDNNVQQVEVFMVHENNTLYKRLPFANGKFILDNDASNPKQERNEETYSFLIVPLNCIQPAPTNVSKVDQAVPSVDLTAKFNVLAAKSHPVMVSFFVPPEKEEGGGAGGPVAIIIIIALAVGGYFGYKKYKGNAEAQTDLNDQEMGAQKQSNDQH